MCMPKAAPHGGHCGSPSDIVLSSSLLVESPSLSSSVFSRQAPIPAAHSFELWPKHRSHTVCGHSLTLLEWIDASFVLAPPKLARLHGGADGAACSDLRPFGHCLVGSHCCLSISVWPVACCLMSQAGFLRSAAATVDPAGMGACRYAVMFVRTISSLLIIRPLFLPSVLALISHLVTFLSGSDGSRLAMIRSSLLWSHSAFSLSASIASA